MFALATEHERSGMEWQAPHECLAQAVEIFGIRHCVTCFLLFISVNVFFTHIGQLEQCYSKVVSGINYEQDLAMAFSLIFLSSIYVYIHTYRNWYVDT